MGQLNYKFRKEIHSRLETSELTSAPFDVTFGSDSDLVKIILATDIDFSFEIKLEKNGRYATYEKPGNLYDSETFYHERLEQAIERIQHWILNLVSDFKAKSLLYGEFEKLWGSIGDQLKNHVEDQNSHFTFQEKEDIFQKLSEMEVKYQVLFEKEKITSEQLEEMRSIIIEMRGTAENYPKGVWYKILWRKLFNASKFLVTTKEGRELLTTGTKLFLPHNQDANLP